MARLIFVSATAATIVAASAHAARPQVCSTFKQAGETFTSFTIGTAWTCASAKSWIGKLSDDRVGHVTKNVPLTNGPRGYHCFAIAGSKAGRATSGTCFKGTLAFPQTGFAWTGS